MESDPKGKPHDEELERYLEWRDRYQQRHRKETRTRVLQFLVATVILLGPFVAWRLQDSGELQFIGRETRIVHAVVDRTTWTRHGGGYFLRVYYQFEYEGQTYEGKFISDRLTGMFHEGECVIVKIAIHDPEKNALQPELQCP
ncbi:hypothetical protein [Sanyastnella coralliicola]|uniref:hypothetical protein n=1 Tax=Sanyastnella coralliicola TaxID=3069118 RepID=UPI0027BA5EC7|nr:hypothetical protein [Longitalea sp. SCSIO 12813]